MEIHENRMHVATVLGWNRYLFHKHTCETSAFVSGVALSWNTSRNSLGLDVIQNSLADSTKC